MTQPIASTRRRLLSLAVMASLQLAACQGSAARGGTITIEGTLILKGNEPFVQPVLVVSDTEHWGLLGLHRSEFENHQNQLVRVKGQVVHGTTSRTARLPSLLVLEFRPRINPPAPASPKRGTIAP
jgi:hypothetical protein